MPARRGIERPADVLEDAQGPKSTYSLAPNVSGNFGMEYRQNFELLQKILSRLSNMYSVGFGYTSRAICACTGIVYCQVTLIVPSVDNRL